MKRSILLSLLLACGASGITLDEINTKPSSRAKNFLIWQYLKQDINASQAQEAFYQIEAVNERFLLDYAQKTDETEIRYTADCLNKISTELMNIEQDDCLYLALTPTKAQNLTSYERERIAARLSNRFGGVEWLHTMNQENHFLPDSEVEESLRLFLISSTSYRDEHFNRPVDPRTIGEITGLKGFGSFVYYAVTDPKLNVLQQSLSVVSGGSYDYQTHFYLGINALRYGRSDNALFHLKEAYAKAPSPMENDRSLFWLYRITQEQNYLDKLSNSLDINMYTLWAKEKLGIETENYYTTLPTPKTGGFRGDDPFEWIRLHREIMATSPDKLYQLVERYEGEDSLAIQAYMIERVYYPYVHNYTMPYERYLEGMGNDQKAMFYALMRQETRMIPGLISRSFALGLMQIMPFNVDAISRIHQLKVNSYNDMFDPQYNIPYAIEHLKHIDDTLFNPVFKAYAYNGGIGFTKRLITTDGVFLPGEYEPFMSMELVGNAESREYGKRVLANYVIYKKILGEKVRISELLDSLTQPSRSDYFRAEALKKAR